MERLQKVLAHAGVASRRKCEVLIQEGRVRVNGETVTELGRKVDPALDRIEVDGKPIMTERKRTFLFYKPLRVITSLYDPQGRPTVADFFRDVDERVYPVGRLDYDTEGLLLMTNDGELANRLTHPKYEADKCYLATVKGHPSEEQLDQLRYGVHLDDGWTSPARVRRMKERRNTTVLEIVIHEGRNRQVRRMCEAIGYPVVHLIRTRIAFLTLGSLKPGMYRELRPRELERLKQLLDL